MKPLLESEGCSRVETIVSPPRFVLAGRLDLLIDYRPMGTPGEITVSDDTSLADVVAERNFYRHLVELGGQDDLEPFIERALELVVATARARHGYLEVRSGSETRDFSVARSTSPEREADYRAILSRGVIAEAIATGVTVITASAIADPRFRERGSVRENAIEAVMCVPIGQHQPVGVIYLQDRDEPGPFTERDREWVEKLARHLEPLVDHLVARRRRIEEKDRTSAVRAKLKADTLVGRSEAIARVLEQVTVVAPHRIGVLIDGATGTGKTQLAWIIHENSPRASQRFVELNCAALPENLLENELFGSAPGAHSAANVAREGKVAAAQGGTLFLDEIGELNLSGQAKLLQLLQSGTYYPLGATSPKKADVRIIAATNRDLKSAIAERTFREDLYYRLNVVPLRLPELSERTDDIPLLAKHFCAMAVTRNDLPALRLSPGGESALEMSEWPGNVRELANVVEAGVLRAASSGLTEVEAHHLFPEAPRESPGAELTYQEQLHRFRRQLVLRTLEETDWNVTLAARRLDVARSYLNRLIRSMSLQRS